MSATIRIAMNFGSTTVTVPDSQNATTRDLRLLANELTVVAEALDNADKFADALGRAAVEKAKKR